MGSATRLLTLFATVGIALFATANLLAGGPPIVNETIHFANEPNVFLGVDPCGGAPLEATTSDSGVIHFTLFADGTVHVTGTIRSTFSADFLPADGIPDATGTIVDWFGENGKIDDSTDPPSAFGHGEATVTQSGKGTFADGTRFSWHELGHIVFNSAGDVKLFFEKARVQCA